jgi:hypothetical protein
MQVAALLFRCHSERPTGAKNPHCLEPGGSRQWETLRSRCSAPLSQGDMPGDFKQALLE